MSNEGTTYNLDARVHVDHEGMHGPVHDINNIRARPSYITVQIGP